VPQRTVGIATEVILSAGVFELDKLVHRLECLLLRVQRSELVRQYLPSSR